MHVNGGVLQIEAPEPLRSLIADCAVHCDVGCCDLKAFEVNAYTMLWWLREHRDDAEDARQQLDLLIAQVAAHAGAVNLCDFCFEWQSSSDCIAYLGTWREEFARAVRIGPQGTPPEQRLREAADRGLREFEREVWRMTRESGAAEPHHPWNKIPEHRERAVNVLSALARLDPRGEGIRNEIEYARRVLSQQGLSW
jgi:hypothetical protein